MANIDDKVVSMSFESSKFESGVNATINALNKLKSALSFPSAGKGLEDIGSAADKVDLSHIGRAVDAIKSKFSALSVVALTVLANIVSKAVTAGLSVLKSFTLDPIMAGFHNYETQINAVQTILANTGLTGKKGLDQVNTALAQLNTYANKTVYNFSEMAKNIGTFTAAGVDLKTSTESIKGIANLAALSGSSAEQASTAMYQLSQAIAAGRVKLQDWNSVVNAGMGGKVFQEALYNTGVAMHTIKDAKLGETFAQWTAGGNTFRTSLQKGWLTSKVLTTTLKGFTGDMTDAQLKAEGFTDAQIKNIQRLAKVATGAATNIKTVTQLQQALKEEVATAYAAVFKTIFGDINQATTLFSKVHTVAENALTKPIYDLNKLLEGWAKLGGRTVAIDAIKTAFKDLSAVMKPIKDAFREIFPPETAKQLYDITKSIDKFMHSLMPSADTINNLKRTFAGLFAILDIGKQIISGIFTVFGKLFGVVSKGGSGFLNLTGNIGDFLVSVDKALKSGNRLHDFFVTLGNVLAAPIAFLVKLKDAVEKVFSGFSQKAAEGFSNAIGNMGGALSPFQKILAAAKVAWDNFTGGFGKIGQALQPAIQGIANMFGSLGQAIGNAVKNMDFSAILEVIRTGLLGGLYLMMKKFLGGGFAKGLGGGILKSISESFEGLTGALTAMQQSIKAGAIEKIAIAIGILTASVVALSLIDAKKMNSSMAALAVGFGELLGAMKIIETLSTGTGFLKLPVISAGLILLATAVDVLVLAVKGLSTLNWQELAKGLGGVSVLLAGLSLASKPLSENSAGMITAGVGITAIAVALKILASAVKDFGGLSWEQLGKGIASVAASLGAIGLASKLFPTGMVQIGIGLIGVGTGLKLLAGAVAQFGGMDLKVLAKGIGGIGLALVALGLALNVMPKSMVAQAAGLLLVSVALKGIASAIASFGGMSIGELAKGLGTLAGSLIILAAALLAMQGSLGGAAALIVAAGAIAILAPAMESLGKQSWGQIIKSMVALAGSMLILGAAGLLLAPVAPALLALGAAMVLIGGGFALAGVGIAAIAAGLSALAISGPVAVGVLVKAIFDFLDAVPKFVQGVVTALLSMVTAIANAAPQFVTALGQILVALANAVVAAAPQLVKAFTALMQAALQTVRDNFPSLVATGFQMLISLMNGIKNNIGQVVNMVVQIVTTMLTSLTSRLPQIVAAGAQALAKLLEGIANNIRSVVNSAFDVVTSFVNGIANNLGKVISAGANILAKFLGGIADNIGKVISQGASIIVHLADSIGDNVGKVISAGTNAIGKFVNAVASGSADLVDKGAQAVINFLNGVANTIRTREPQMIAAGANVGVAIVQGMINGVGSLAGALLSKVESLISSLPHAALKLLHIGSPSKVFYDIGVNLVLGLTNAIDDKSDTATASVENMVTAMVDAVNTIPALTGLDDLNPVITPVLDLTLVKAGADQMNAMIDTSPVAVASSGQAASISSSQAQSSTDESISAGTTAIKFEQNNYSPESLSPVEIYRQTKNQLSQIRLALA